MKKSFFNRVKRRKGMSMVELILVMIVMATLTSIALYGGGAARDNANRTSTQSDIKAYTNAIQQMISMHPEIMKFTKNKPNAALKTLVGYINDQMEEQWQFEILPNAEDSGGVATSTIQRDAWGNPYGLYVYFDDKAATYADKGGTALKESDSCVYIVVTSAGKNSTGGPVGFDGNNFDTNTRKIAAASAMVNNTDGVDDMGAIARVLNGDVYIATFGFDQSTLGTLEGKQWIFGVPTANGGICYDYEAVTNKTPSTGGSVDQYYDQLQVEGITGNVVGSW